MECDLLLKMKRHKENKGGPIFSFLAHKQSPFNIFGQWHPEEEAFHNEN